ncbi:uncharacterized protein V1510DRAFT_278260 [Dipodascopsis tothii]|uniref:uncharacterized protein n=1 Tax=Dipodascopsis tothii TaxID=44089 RepID=UPI0034CE4714
MNSDSAGNRFAALAADEPQGSVGELPEIETEAYGFTALGKDAVVEAVRPIADPAPWSKLLAVANGRGLFAAAGADGFVVDTLETLRQAFAAGDKKYTGATHAVAGTVSYVGFTSDERYLLVATVEGDLSYYAIDGLSAGTAPINTLKVQVRELRPNPLNGAEIAILGADGVLTVANIAAASSTKIAEGVTAFDWSPKGKQLVVGNAAGELVQYTPAGEPRAQIRRAMNDDLTTVSMVTWLETHLFLVVYARACPPGEHDYKAYMVRRETPSNAISFAMVLEPCAPFGLSARGDGWHTAVVRGWDATLPYLIMLASNPSSDISLLTEKESYYLLDEMKRASLPFHNGTETSPVGLALDFTATAPVANPIPGIEQTAALPTLWLMNTEGQIKAWTIIWSDGIKAGHAATDKLLARVQADRQTALAAAAQGPAPAAAPAVAPAAAPTPTAFGSTPASGFGTTPAPTSGFGSTPAPTSGFGAAPAFGQSAFGQAKPAFGQSGFGEAKPAFGQSSFGQAKPAFGQSSFGAKPAFGQSSFGAAPATGASQPAKTGGFASFASPTTPFGGSSGTASPFSQPASATSTASPFGQASSNASPFGQSASNASPFGQPAASATPFGQPTSNAASSSPLGQSAANASPFGQPAANASPFGQPAANASPFGQASSNASPFGQAASTASPFGQTQPTFGQKTDTPFGQAKTESPFGQAKTESPFGQAKTEVAVRTSQDGVSVWQDVYCPGIRADIDRARLRPGVRGLALWAGGLPGIHSVAVRPGGSLAGLDRKQSQARPELYADARHGHGRIGAGVAVRQAGQLAVWPAVVAVRPALDRRLWQARADAWPAGQTVLWLWLVCAGQAVAAEAVVDV